MNLLAMELLDRGNTFNYSHPVPTVVPLTPTPGKAILVSGHDLKALEELLKQTAGMGINIYFKLLSEKYHLQPITSPERDLAACLA